jgi:hypothetical protein
MVVEIILVEAVLEEQLIQFSLEIIYQKLLLRIILLGKIFIIKMKM